MDQGRALNFSGGSRALSSTITANARGDEQHERREHSEEDEDEGMQSEAHEFFGNLLVLAVGLPVTYLLLFKRPVALFMLFLDRRKSQSVGPK